MEFTARLSLFIALVYLCSFGWITTVSAQSEHAPQLAPAAQTQAPEHAIKCDRGGAAEQFGCFEERLRHLEQEMDSLLKQAVDSYTSMWGDKAVEEGRHRLLESQDDWKKYRNKHCSFGSYSKAPSRPASHDAHTTACKVDKTNERIAEIKSKYLHQSR